MATYISPGEILSGYIAAGKPTGGGVGVLYGPVSLEYKPADRLECAKLDGQVRVAMKDAENNVECVMRAEKIVSTFVADRVTKWDLKDPSGNPVPITPDTCGRIHFDLFNQIYALIRNTRTSDRRPEPESTWQPSAEATAVTANTTAA